MRVRTKATNFNLTPEFKSLVEDKLGRSIEKYTARLDDKSNLILDIELEKISSHHLKGKIWRCEAMISMPYKKLPIRAEAITEDLRTSVDEVQYELERELRKSKDKMRTKKLKGLRELRRRLTGK